MHGTASRRAGADSWVEQAACRNADPETFFPATGRTDAKDPEAAAKRLCATCPVVERCLREALRFEESTGIWGGLNVRERRELLRVAATLETIAPELAALLANGRRHVQAPQRDRPAYVWFLRRAGWSPRRIADTLGLTFRQVQDAWRTAEFASTHTRGTAS